MRLTRTGRRTATALALALTLGTAGPATAQPIGGYTGGGLKPTSPYASNISYTTPTPTLRPKGAGSEWAYVAIGSGAAGLALVGVGGTVAAGRRRQRREARSGTTMAA